MSERSEWIGVDVALAIHAEQLEAHGGGEGVRDLALLESALARPWQLAAYGGMPDVYDLAAAYAHGVAKNDPFVDGNQRTAWVLARLYLALHGIDYAGSDGDAVIGVLQLAGEHDAISFAAWLRANGQPLA